jgi:hypothetical protein
MGNKTNNVNSIAKTNKSIERKKERPVHSDQKWMYNVVLVGDIGTNQGEKIAETNWLCAFPPTVCKLLHRLISAVAVSQAAPQSSPTTTISYSDSPSHFHKAKCKRN